MKFRNKPVVVEAEHFTSKKPCDPTANGLYATVTTGRMFMEYPVLADEKGEFLVIPTLEGKIRANPGDWIVTGIKGERYTVRPETFAAMFAPAEDTVNQDPLPPRDWLHFRKKLVEVTAIRNLGAENWCDVYRFLHPELMALATPPTRPVQRSNIENYAATPNGAVRITTLKGVMLADLGDWIVKGMSGEFYPVKPDIFEATYEPAE